MGAFRKALSKATRGRSESRSRWLFVPYDQLSDRIGPLASESPDDIGIVLVECPAKAARRPYHQQKLALVLANLRHFALEQAQRGVAVRHVVSDGDYASALAQVIDDVGPLQMMEAAERELREELASLVEAGDLEVLPHEGWLTTEADFDKGAGAESPWRMDRFYRHVRKRTGLLMKDGKPLGGKWSLDADNREPWKGEPPLPDLPTFPRDEIKEEVAALIESEYADHPGSVDVDQLPATAMDAKTLWTRAMDECMEHFGPYEDAMTTQSSGLFHTRISPLLNLHRLLPKDVVNDVAESDAPINSREGFVRQVLGWREFVRHVHRKTDGFRSLGAKPPDAPSHLGSDASLPAAFWPGATSGLHCLDTVVNEVWDEAYSHHITRLMILSNLATLLDISPRELTDWFWVAYADAYDWVVEPNVLGMGTFAVGDVMTTKPYISGSAYINRMSDYCGDCAFHPKKTCPITPLYWAFLARHEDALGDLHRMRPVMASLGRRADDKRKEDKRIFTHVSRALAKGEQLEPDA